MGVPSAVYPAAVVESGKRFEAKSNAEDMEYVRSWGSGRLREFGVALERGSSFEMESLRDEDMPDREELGDVSRVGDEEASDASSRESRGGSGDVALSLE